MSVPALRFKDDAGQDFPEWETKKLGSVFSEITEKIESNAIQTFSISAGKGFVSQQEKFGRDISGKQNKNYIRLKPFEFAYNKGNSKTFKYGCVYANTTGIEIAVPNIFISFGAKLPIATDFYCKLFEKHYLDVFLKKIISSSARMDGLLNVSKKDFFKIDIPYPALKEQTKIANFLTAVDEKITHLTQKHDLLTQYKKGVMQQIFSHSKERSDCTVSYPRGTSQELRFKDDDGEDFPEWEETNLGNVLEIQGGYAFKSTSFNTGNTMVIRIGDILPNIKLGSFIGVFSSEVPNNKYIVKKNDFMMALSGATFGKVGKIIDDGIAYINQRVATFRTKQNLEFFYQVVQSQDFRNYIASIPTASAQPNISNDDIGRYEIAVPSIAEQLKIANFLTAIDDKITTVQTQLQAVKQYKQGLLQQMFV